MQNLRKEFRKIGYGCKSINLFSQDAKKYIIDRHIRGIEELKRFGKYPSETGDNGYTELLGMWSYTKSKGLNCAIGTKQVWMASILNNELI